MRTRHVLPTVPWLTTTVALLLAPLDAVARSPAATAPPGPTIALLPLVASGYAADEIGPLDAVVQTAAAKHYGGRVVAGAEMAARLQRGGVKGIQCERIDPTCSAQLGAVSGADRVLVASLTLQAASSTLVFRLVDVAEATQLAYASGPASPAVRVDEVRAVLAALEAPAARRTELVVNGPIGAPLVVDAQERGALPGEPITDLAPGAHAVRIGGDAPFSITVDLRRGEPVTITPPAAAPVAASQEPPVDPRAVADGTTQRTDPAPPTSPVPLIVGGSGAAALVAGGVLLAIGLSPLIALNGNTQALAQLEAQAANDPGTLDADRARITEEHAAATRNEDAWRGWGTATAIAGGVLLTAGAIAVGVGVALWAGE